MYRVLHVADIADGGISMVILNWYKNLDRERIRFDIASTVTNTGNNAAQLQELGANIYFIPMKAKGIAAYKEALTKILRDGHYDAIHVHESQTSYVALRLARQMGIKKRVAHSHTSAPFCSPRGELARLSGCLLNYHYATDVVGCGILAGQRVFGKLNMKRPKAHVLKNGIYLDDFKYREDVREEVRKELGISDRFVVGMVGRLSAEKNYCFAFEIIEKLKEKKTDCLLIVAGDGPQRDELQTYVNNHNLEDYVVFLGNRSDANRLYMAMDAFLLPSVHEGFPVVAVEALASGLPVLLSDTITTELGNFKQARYLSIEDSCLWANILCEVNIEAQVERVKAVECLKHNGFDSKDVAKELEQLIYKVPR